MYQSDLKRSLDLLVNRMVAFSRFPKYSLERRVDIFLAPFLEAYVTTRLGRPARLVAPEFPVLADLSEMGPHAELPVRHPPAPKKLSRRTVNVDYLFHLPSTVHERPEWLFVELKTDARSFDSDQADVYAIARLRGMRQLRDDLDFVWEKTDQREKYEVLIGAMGEVGNLDPIRVAYVAPGELETEATEHMFPRTDRQKDMCRTSTSERTVAHFLSLERFREVPEGSIDPAFLPLWPTVAELLERVLRASRASSRR